MTDVARIGIECVLFVELFPVPPECEGIDFTYDLFAI